MAIGQARGFTALTAAGGAALLLIALPLALVAQVGFIVHQLAFLEPALGPLQAALAVSA